MSDCEFVDCGSLSISYDATGKASVSLTVMRCDSNEINYTSYNSGNIWGGVRFDLIIMSASQKPIVGSSWHEWGLSMEGVGN